MELTSEVAELRSQRAQAEQALRLTYDPQEVWRIYCQIRIIDDEIRRLTQPRRKWFVF